VAIVRERPCRCGSGVPERACHDPRGAPGDELRLLALGWIHGLAELFPFLRPTTAPALAFAERVARELGPADSDVPPEVVEEGLALLGASERARLVDVFAAPHPEEWTAVGRDLGDDGLARRVLAAGAVRSAIDDRRLPPRRLLDDFESGVAPSWPAAIALALALRPQGVWSIEEARKADRAGSVHDLFGARWSAEIKRVAMELLADEQRMRVRMLALALAQQLPIEGRPRASACLAGACERIAGEPLFADEAAVASLAAYVAHFHALPQAAN
jgi:hypothetical protein